MKPTLTLLLFLTAQSTLLLAQKDFYPNHWSRVYKYELKALPQSALAVVDSIYLKAKKEKNIPQVTKALIYQSKFSLTLQEDAELFITQRIQKEISDARPPLRNILESIIANVYWEYFRQNRWKYYNRSRTHKKDRSEDFRLWDLESMFKEIHSHYQASLHDASLLKGISLATINDILIQAQNSKSYRPTLFDFLVHNALDFYEAGESSLPVPTQSFEFNDPRYFEDFGSVAVPTQDTLFPEMEAIKLYKSLSAFHQGDKDPSAFLSNELERLQFIVDKGNFENASELHQAALKKLKLAYRQYPASTLIDYQLASLLNKQGKEYNPKTNPANQFKKKEALVICEKAISDFPTADGAEQCKVLRNEILKQRLAITAEEFVPIDKPARLLITFSNIDSLAFTAYPISRDFERQFYRPISDSTRLADINAMTPEIRWNAALPDLQDDQEHSTEVVMPKLSGGRYLLVARVKQGTQAAPTFAHATIQVTNLVMVESSFDKVNRYQVVDRNNGSPVEGAIVTFKSESPNSNDDSINYVLTANKNGFLELERTRNASLNLNAEVKYKNDKAEFGDYNIRDYYRDQSNADETVTAKAFLFSDRSIYRPGQTVYFKGILIKTQNDKSSIVAGQYVEVELDDPNDQDVGLLRLKTNSFGSFSGEFKLPATGLTGEYLITADEDDEGESRFYDNLDDFSDSELTISVEEYKRPTFEVAFKPIKETFKLNDSIRVRGTALSFSGAKVTGAKVSYRVKRNVRYPDWNYWNRGNSYSNEQEIEHGEAVTDSIGEFSIIFKSIPDPKVSKEGLPVFEFEVSADVTDLNGETRSSTTTARVGYQSMTARINSPLSFNRQIPEHTITVLTENLNAQAVPSQGALNIYKLKSPANPQRQRPWPAPDLPKISREEFAALFPNDPYDNVAYDQKLETGRLQTMVSFNTTVSGEVKFKVDKSWELGTYFIELRTTDETGDTIKAKSRFELFDPANTVVTDNKMLIVEADKSDYKIGDVARVKIGSASRDISVVVDLERNSKIVKTFVKHLSGKYTEIQIPITEDDAEGLTIHYGGANFNAFFNGTNRIIVMGEKSNMEIETVAFKDKLQPGGKETWSFAITGNDPLTKEAEVLASMYDASLDQFKPHAWTFDPIEKRYHYNQSRFSFDRSFGTSQFVVRNLNYGYYIQPRLYFDQFDNFGFSITDSRGIHQTYLNRIFSIADDSLNRSKVSQSSNKNLKKGYISGRITGEDGSPVPGVNVVIKGTTTGTTTDVDGNYSIQADKGDELVFSFVGYSTAEATVGRKNILNVSLAEDVKQLSEVVVSALGVSMSKNLSSSVSSTTMYGEGIFKEAVLALDGDPLYGRVAGVQITGVPGGRAKLLIRGASSLGNNSNPLYVLDGVIVESSRIDKEDLESLQVLKGDAATALYGSKGANGVIIITTKSGQKKLDEELAKVNVRKNFNETAFFFPHLTTNESGRIQFSFTTPESLTRWKLQLLAHNKDLESATKTLIAVTQKDFMVTPNLPRFLRTGDEILFSTKIINLTGNSYQGAAALQLTNAVNGEPVDQSFQNTGKNQSFKISPKGNTQVSWKLKIPAGVDAVQYRIVAKAGNFSDGEQNALPVLANRILVTETMPMFIRAGETKSFTLDKLKNNSSATLQNHQLSLEVTTNPAWFAVQALPYLMEFPYECSEQTFSRYYANTLASYVANKNPLIREVFDKWASSNALTSNLEKNPELKSTIIQETPWLRDAQNEAEQKKRIALLFDLGTMGSQLHATSDKLQQMQLADGGFTWFSGGSYSSRYITQHVACGFGHLKALKVVNAKDPLTPSISKAVAYLDNEILKDYTRLSEMANTIKAQARSSQEGAQLAKEYLERQQVWNNQVHYLYMRSFFPDIKIPDNILPAVSYYQNQTIKYWKNFNLYFKGMTALIQYRNQNKQLAADILKSLRENSIVSDEMGMYWKENKAGWYWHEAPVETQALLIEAFAEVEASDTTISAATRQKTIDDLRIWLLKNKRTNQWSSTKATTEAIYALLLNGTEWLSIDDNVELTVGGKKVTPGPKSPEAGTGYFKTSWPGNQVTPEMAKVKFTKKGSGIAWGGLYWQYFEDLDKITLAATPLKLTKKVFLVSREDKGELLTEVEPGSSIAIGSLIRIRIELKADQDMEFLHMKDMRASGLEPVDVLSEYKWKDNLGYYQSTKDASTNFFFDAVPKGVYVFEYDLRANNKGNFSNGITTIQSMYAPEFSSHSEGTRIRVE